MKKTTSERLKDFIGSKGMTTQEFEQLCQLSNGYVNNIRKTVGEKSLERILEHFPELDVEWLNYGIGDNSNTASNIGGDNQQNSGAVIEALTNQLTEKDRQIAKSQEQIDRLLSIIEKMNS